jgi:hypothetical protein
MANTPSRPDAGNGQVKRFGAGGQHELIIGQVLLNAAVEIADQNGFLLAVDGQGPGPGQRLHPLGILEKSNIADNMETGRPQLALVRDIAADIIGNAAAAVGNQAVLINHGDLPVRLQPPQPAGCLGAGGNRPDNNDFLAHGTSLLSKALSGKWSR